MQKSVVLSWIVAFLLSSPFAVGQEAEASSTEPDAGKSSPVGKEEGREIAQKLLNDLDDILSKTTSAHQRVERVSQIIKAINRRVGQGSADGTVVIKATEELVAILKRSLDQLYQDAHAIRDGVKNDVLPE